MSTSTRGLTVSLFLLGSLLAGCPHDKSIALPTTPPAAAQTPAASPLMVIDERVHDFGVVNRGTELRHAFTIKNAGNAVLKIENVIASCGCTAATVDNDQIPPGGQASLAVRMSTQFFMGPGSKGIQVAANDPHNPTVSLEIKYDIRRLLVIEPDVIHLVSERGRPRIEKAWLAGDLVDQAKPRVVKVRGGDDQVLVKVLEERQQGSAKKGFELKLKGKRPITGDGDVTISTGLPSPAELVLRFTVQVDG